MPKPTHSERHNSFRARAPRACCRVATRILLDHDVHTTPYPDFHEPDDDGLSHPSNGEPRPDCATSAMQVVLRRNNKNEGY